MARGKGSRAMKPSDFIPDFDRQPASQSDIQMQLDARFKAMAASMNKKKGG